VTQDGQTDNDDHYYSCSPRCLGQLITEFLTNISPFTAIYCTVIVMKKTETILGIGISAGKDERLVISEDSDARKVIDVVEYVVRLYTTTCKYCPTGIKR